MSLIELKGINKTYKTDSQDFYALRDINLKIEKGNFIAVAGKSGSGKSTLMNLVAGIDKPTAGEVIIRNLYVHRLGESEMARWRGINIGVVFQFFQLLPTLTVIENVMLPMDFCRTFPRTEARERALDLLDQVGIKDQAHKFPSALSGGQQQRAAIARAMANDPAILVADEPTGNLDTQTSLSVMALLCELARSGKTILMVTHEKDLSGYADRIITLSDGKIFSDKANLKEASNA